MHNLPSLTILLGKSTYLFSKYPALTAVPIKLQINRPAVTAVIPLRSRLGVISTTSIPTTLPLFTRPCIRVRI